MLRRRSNCRAARRVDRLAVESLESSKGKFIPRVALNTLLAWYRTRCPRQVDDQVFTLLVFFADRGGRSARSCRIPNW